MMWSPDYCLLVFIAVVGVIQLGALRNNFRGLLFFPRRTYTLIFAFIAIGVALFVFFTWNDFHEYIIEGSQQTGSFVLSTAAAIVFTLICSSFLNMRRLNPGKPKSEGLEGLRESTFFKALNNHWSEEE